MYLDDKVYYFDDEISCFGPFFRPSSGCIRLALRIMYLDDKVHYFDDEISCFGPFLGHLQVVFA